MNAILKDKIDQRISNVNSNNGLCFELLTEADRLALQKNSKILKFQRKSVVYNEGEPPKGVYIITKGKIKFSQLNHDGAVQILFIYGPTMIFGHRTILSNDKQPITATALEDCELMYIEKEHFLNTVQTSTHFSNLLMQTLSHEFSIMVNRINIFAQRGIKERLALFLLTLNELYKNPYQSHEDAEITMNRNDLAGYTGTSVENLVRTLKVFKESNYIRTTGKSIYINDFNALYSMTGV